MHLLVPGPLQNRDHLVGALAIAVGRQHQHGQRAEVSLTARYPEIVTTPESGIDTQEIYVLFGTAVASEADNVLPVGTDRRRATSAASIRRSGADVPSETSTMMGMWM